MKRLRRMFKEWLGVDRLERRLHFLEREVHGRGAPPRPDWIGVDLGRERKT